MRQAVGRGGRKQGAGVGSGPEQKDKNGKGQDNIHLRATGIAFGKGTSEAQVAVDRSVVVKCLMQRVANR